MGGATLFVAIFLGCRNDENVSFPTENQKLSSEAKQAFQKESPQFSILKYASKIEWGNPIVSNGAEYDAVEIPLILNDKIGAKIGDELSKPSARLLLRKSKTSNQWDFYFLLISNGNNIQNNKITYNQMQDNFPNKIAVFDKDNKIVSSFNLGGKTISVEKL
ncbi:hypothetical protein SAMN05421847_1133 [Halpernia humi]|uniref:Uncharacterized protein n=1 Tax=Halpernia humi TaxID=493375 RepID=A0A1H5W8N4_9FLAO|nr:hypothetical protein [Halpernia humi]SEF95832.1 hypothetical protein SAMN05421847_1133 [Halpernia humi]